MSGGIVELTAETFAAVAGRGVALLDFYAVWCEHCQLQAPIMEQVASTLGERAVVGKVNVDAEPDLVNRFNVGVFPSHIFLRDGEEMGRLIGVQKADTLISGIEELL